MIVEKIKEFGTVILDTIFPIECLGCKKEGEWICKQCLGRLPIAGQESCFACKKESTGGRTCFSCMRTFPMARMMRFFDYDEPMLKEAIRIAKYALVKEALTQLVGVMLPYLPGTLEPCDTDPRALLFVPVPLHPRRFRERGFNQAELIASACASACGASYSSALTRVRYTLPQADLDETDRARNIARAFVCPDPSVVQGRYVVLTDDVATTGATLTQCARALLDAGACEVSGLVLAKG